MSLFHGRRKKSKSSQESRLPCILGSNGLFTKMVCFYPLRVALWER